MITQGVPVSACIKALLGIVTDTVLVTFVRPFLALGVSLAIVHTNIWSSKSTTNHQYTCKKSSLSLLFKVID